MRVGIRAASASQTQDQRQERLVVHSESGEVFLARPVEHRCRPVDLVAQVHHPGHDRPDLGRDVRPRPPELLFLYGAAQRELPPHGARYQQVNSGAIRIPRALAHGGGRMEEGVDR